MNLNSTEHYHTSIRYAVKDDPFFKVLRQKVNSYFSSNGISKYANRSMIIKTIILFVLWVSAYALVLSNLLNGFSLIFAIMLFHITMFQMSIGIAHDGSHNAFRKSLVK